jgi:acetyl-CoA carboxylase biotin carboxylase subunit
VTWRGWAIECRINAEDPTEGFVPSPGRIEDLRVPAGPGVRDDSGVYAGATVSRFYDTLMAKVIVWGPDRDAALARMRRALAEYRITGVRSTIPVLERIMADPEFTAGRLHTGFMERLLAEDAGASASSRRLALIAAALAAYESAASRAPASPASGPSAWTMAGRVWPRPR